MERQTVAIIGMGFSGITAGVKLLSESEEPIDVVYIERCEGNKCGGVAYGKGSAEPCHETNISAERMGYKSDDPDADPKEYKRVVSRLQFGKSLRRAHENATFNMANPDSSTVTINGAALDIYEDDEDGKAIITLDNGQDIVADQVIVATGNHEIKQIGCVTDQKLADPEFAGRFIHNQWLESEKEELDLIPYDAPTLVIGTALSGYDAVRSLLRRGHEGPITMVSRNAYEHFQYPEDHVWQDIDLGTPGFINLMRSGVRPEGVIYRMLNEFEDLTGYKIDLDSGKVEFIPERKQASLFEDLRGVFGDAAANRKSRTPQPAQRQLYMPEQVLKSWEKFVPEVIEEYGVEAYGRVFGKYSSLITTMRVGAGHNICEEIKAAKERGQLEVIAAGVADIDNDGADDYGRMGVDFLYTHPEDHDGEVKERKYFHSVISSLGANQNYARTRDPLWSSMIKDWGYTEPHEIGIGVKIMTDEYNYGRLPGSERIYAIGTPTAGENMIQRAILGPPAFSVPGMRKGIEDTVNAVLDKIRDRGRELFIQEQFAARAEAKRDRGVMGALRRIYRGEPLFKR